MEENASKALMITAGVLIGVMILSLGVFLYHALNTYTTSTQERMEFNAQSKFNAQFTAYVNNPSIRIQDIITVANLANQNNIEGGLTIADEGEESHYVTVNAYIEAEGRTMQNIEQEVVSKSTEWLSGDNGYLYTCTEVDVKYSKKTGRIYEINFH